MALTETDMRLLVEESLTSMIPTMLHEVAFLPFIRSQASPEQAQKWVPLAEQYVRRCKLVHFEILLIWMFRGSSELTRRLSWVRLLHVMEFVLPPFINAIGKQVMDPMSRVSRRRLHLFLKPMNSRFTLPHLP